jgi:hypothetical protein
MPQAPGLSDVIARRTDAVVAVFRGTVGAGGLEVWAAMATRSQRPRRVATFTSTSPTTAVVERAAPDVQDGVRLTFSKDQIRDLPPIDLAEPQ